MFTGSALHRSYLNSEGNNQITQILHSEGNNQILHSEGNNQITQILHITQILPKL